jgi:hypothetical protein
VRAVLEGQDAPSPQPELQAQPESVEQPDPNQPKWRHLLETDENREISDFVQGNQAQQAQAVQAAQQAIANAALVTQSALVADFPEFAGLDPQQLEGAIRAMSQRDPTRHEAFLRRAHAVQAAINQATQVQTAQAQAVQQQAAASFHQWGQQQDAAFEKMIASENPETVKQVRAAIPEVAKEYGVDVRELVELFHSNPVMRSAPFQKMIFDAVRWNMTKKSIQRAPVEAPKGMMRPGTSQSRPSVDQLEHSAVARAFNENPDPRSGARLLQARRAQAARNR